MADCYLRLQATRIIELTESQKGLEKEMVIHFDAFGSRFHGKVFRVDRV